MNDDDEDDEKYEGSAAWLEAALIEAISDSEGEDLAGARATPFSETGLMTRDSGIVVRLRDGSEFQVTIVKSRGAR